MSDDLLKRLRMDVEPTDGDMETAADEIKRLREALDCIVWMIDTSANIQDIDDVARAALGEEKK